MQVSTPNDKRIVRYVYNKASRIRIFPVLFGEAAEWFQRSLSSYHGKAALRVYTVEAARVGFVSISTITLECSLYTSVLYIVHEMYMNVCVHVFEGLKNSAVTPRTALRFNHSESHTSIGRLQDFFDTLAARIIKADLCLVGDVHLKRNCRGIHLNSVLYS